MTWLQLYTLYLFAVVAVLQPRHVCPFATFVTIAYGLVSTSMWVFVDAALQMFSGQGGPPSTLQAIDGDRMMLRCCTTCCAQTSLNLVSGPSHNASASYWLLAVTATANHSTRHIGHPTLPPVPCLFPLPFHRLPVPRPDRMPALGRGDPSPAPAVARRR